MQVRPGGAAGIAAVADQVAGVDDIPGSHARTVSLKMHVVSKRAVGVGDQDVVALLVEFGADSSDRRICLHLGNHSTPCGMNRSAGLEIEIESVLIFAGVRESSVVTLSDAMFGCVVEREQVEMIIVVAGCPRVPAGEGVLDPVAPRSAAYGVKREEVVPAGPCRHKRGKRQGFIGDQIFNISQDEIEPEIDYVTGVRKEIESAPFIFFGVDTHFLSFAVRSAYSQQ